MENELEVVNIRLVKEPSLYSEQTLDSPQAVVELMAKETPTPETPGTTTKTSNPPKTGDTENVALWIAILVLSAAGITGVRIWNNKKQVKR